MILKGAVTLRFGFLTNDREGGLRGGAAKATMQKWATIQAAWRIPISTDIDQERREKAARGLLFGNEIWQFKWSRTCRIDESMSPR